MPLTAITLDTFRWDKRPIQAKTNLGYPYKQWIKTGMPRVPDNTLHLVVFLYKDEADAEAGKNQGGSGFVIGYPCKDARLKNHFHHYVVTNYHVMKDASWVRINSKGELKPQIVCPIEWETDRINDIAVAELDIDVYIAEMTYWKTEHFVTPALMDDCSIGIGDDAFMCGRFVDIGGIERNNPALRFGNLSMMPTPIKREDDLGKFETESFCLDMHSRTGFSGSPAMIYRLPQTNLEALYEGQRDQGWVYLLGIHWGNIRERWKVKTKDGGKTDFVTHGQSGMTCVTPAWRILEVLEREHFVKRREKEEQEVIEKGDFESVAQNDLADGDGEEENAKRDSVLKKMLETPPKPKGK